MRKKKNIILVGFMGSGKTSIGMKLARAFSYEFLDSDNEIEQEQQKKINAIFAEQGEEAFREMETQFLVKLCGKKKKFVLGTGGGMPIREENITLLKKLGTVVFLKAGEEELVKHLKNDTTRPLLAEGDLYEKIHTLYAKRLPVYESVADYIVQTDGKTFYEIIKEIEEFYFPEKKEQRKRRKEEALNRERAKF